MNQPSQPKHTGTKIWYGAVIALSALMILLCAVSLVGAWVLQSKLSDTTVALLQTAEDLAGRVQQVIAQVQDPLDEIQQISTKVADASEQLSQNVQDEGLLRLLLPPEMEQKLVNLGTTVQSTLATIHEILSSAAELYEAINNIPFVNLPTPSLEKVRAAEQSVNDIRLAIEELKGKVSEVRSGAAEKIDVVTEIANRVAQKSDQILENLALLDAELTGFQQTLAQVRGAIPTLFALGTFLLTLVLVYIGYTQVVVIRLFHGRWKLLQAMSAQLPPEIPPDTAEPIPVQPVPEPLPEETPPAGEGADEKAQE